MGEGFLQSINIFSYGNLWRINGNSQVSHKFGGCMSILLVLVMGAITIVQFWQVIQMNQIKFTSQNSKDFSAPLFNITTQMENKLQSQFMFAVNLAGLSPSEVLDMEIISSLITRSYNDSTQGFGYSYQYFTLDKCTPQHFSTLPNIYQNFDRYGMNYNWFCLPLNKSFQLGGVSTGFHKSLQFDVTCRDKNCSALTNEYFSIYGFLMTNFVNPANNTPYEPFLSIISAPFIKGVQTQTALYLDKIQLITDTSLLPFSTFQTQTSILFNRANDKSQRFSNQPWTTFYIEMSGSVTTINRSYLKFLDALSFVGGIFNPLIGLLFFMASFGRLFYEIQLAKQMFREKKIKSITFFSYLKESIYSMLKSINRQPNWQSTKERCQLRKTVNNLLDIVYLQRRLSFIERAMSILFDKHQLYGLYLTSAFTHGEVDNNYQNHRFRNRFMHHIIFKENQQEKDQQQKVKKRNSISQGINSNKNLLSEKELRQQFERPFTRGKYSETNRQKCSQKIASKDKLQMESEFKIKSNQTFSENKPIQQQNLQSLQENEMVNDQILQKQIQPLSQFYQSAMIKKQPLSNRIMQRIDQRIRIRLLKIIKQHQLDRLK